MLGTHTWFKTVRCHSIWVWLGAKSRTFPKGSAQLPAQLFPLGYDGERCSDITFFIWLFGLFFRGGGLCRMIRNKSNVLFQPNLSRSGELAHLKVLPVSMNATADSMFMLLCVPLVWIRFRFFFFLSSLSGESDSGEGVLSTLFNSVTRTQKSVWIVVNGNVVTPQTGVEHHRVCRYTLTTSIRFGFFSDLRWNSNSGSTGKQCHRELHAQPLERFTIHSAQGSDTWWWSQVKRRQTADSDAFTRWQATRRWSFFPPNEVWIRLCRMDPAAFCFVPPLQSACALIIWACTAIVVVAMTAGGWKNTF